MKEIDEKIFSGLNEGSEKICIEDMIEHDEKILWEGKPDKRSYVFASVFKMMPIAILWLIFDSAFIGLFISNSFDVPFVLKLILVVFFAVHLMPVWIWIYNMIKATREVRNLRYAFTNRKIIVQSGAIGIDFKIVNYAEISGINVKVGLADKIFKVGDVYINSTSQTVVLFDIKEPYKIYSVLQKIANDIKSDIIYPNALRPQVNPGYHTDYIDLNK